MYGRTGVRGHDAEEPAALVCHRVTELHAPRRHEAPHGRVGQLLCGAAVGRHHHNKGGPCRLGAAGLVHVRARIGAQVPARPCNIGLR